MDEKLKTLRVAFLRSRLRKRFDCTDAQFERLEPVFYDQDGFCVLCLFGMPRPIPLEGAKRPALICGRCHAAILKNGDDINKLRAHRRFQDHPGRLRRLIDLYSSEIDDPNEPLREAPEQIEARKQLRKEIRKQSTDV